MAEILQTGDGRTRVEPRDPALLTWTHTIYALHAASVVVGLIGAASVVGAFIWGPIPIVAVILNYIKRSEVRGTYLESHFSWQIRTFWYAVLWAALATFLFFTIIGIPFALGLYAILGIWVIYRVARGWLALKNGDPVPM